MRLVAGVQRGQFDDPVHKYDALEFTFNRRGANWSAMASYRYSRLRGNFEGFYRDDNGQSDPGISSLYDFPTNDPTYTSIGDPLRLSRATSGTSATRTASCRSTGRTRSRCTATTCSAMGLNLGVNLNLSSGKPLTPMAANPNYTNAGDSGGRARLRIQTIDGFMTRTPFQSQVDFQASYALTSAARAAHAAGRHLQPVQRQQRTLDYDQNTELTYPNATRTSGSRQHDPVRDAAAVPGAAQHPGRRAVRVLNSLRNV